MVINEQQLVAKLHYPQDSIPVNAGGTVNAGGSLVVTLPAAVNRKTYLAKAIITSRAPATLAEGTVTISDGTFTLPVELEETVTAGGFMNLDFADAPIVSTGTNTAITVNIPTISGGSRVSVLLVGYQR